VSGNLVKFDAMRSAITEAHAMDEVKDLRDKAMALELYAKQANDWESERQCREIRVRAERRCGELLSQREMAKGARGNPGGQGASIVPSAETRAQKTLAELGISYDQSSQWQKLAAVPERDFEEALANPLALTSGAMIIAGHEARTNPPDRSPVDDRALWLWGRLLDFSRNGLLELDPLDLFKQMPEHMRETILSEAPRVAAWLERMSRGQ
jgi:hypothetical protein